MGCLEGEDQRVEAEAGGGETPVLERFVEYGYAYLYGNACSVNLRELADVFHNRFNISN